MKILKSFSALLFVLGFLIGASSIPLHAEGGPDGLGIGLGNLDRLSNAQSRSIGPENFTGEKGAGGMATTGTGAGPSRDLGQGWKVSPSVVVKAHTTFTLAAMQGPGCIRQIWMTPTGNFHHSILRFYWDDEADPSVEVPVGDFFACGLGQYAQVNSLAVCVNPLSGLNCYWPMPFAKSARVTLENIDDKDMVIYYQINYTLQDVPENAGYFHAQFRRQSPVQNGSYTILDNVTGQGQYVGTYLVWGTHHAGWWGEGEIKFFLDGDKDYPTICGTGTEDYFCGSYDFEVKGADGKGHYTPFSTPYSGMIQVVPLDPIYQPGQRIGLYRWHITDPVYFQQDLKVTIQSLGWQAEHKYLQLDDDITSVAYWYQKEPHNKFPPLPDREHLDLP